MDKDLLYTQLEMDKDWLQIQRSHAKELLSNSLWWLRKSGSRTLRAVIRIVVYQSDSNYSFGGLDPLEPYPNQHLGFELPHNSEVVETVLGLTLRNSCVSALSEPLRTYLRHFHKSFLTVRVKRYHPFLNRERSAK